MSLFNTLNTVSAPVVKNDAPLTMEQLDQATGYLLYRVQLQSQEKQVKDLRVVDCPDRISVYADHELLATQDDGTRGDNIAVDMPASGERTLDLLFENIGRVCYGPNLTAPMQYKGIHGGVMVAKHFLLNYEHYSLSMNNRPQIDWDGGAEAGTPTFAKFKFNVDEVADTYLDYRQLGKGIVFVNGENIGRYWSKGPYGSLYVPKELLREGENEIIVFETMDKEISEISLTDHAVYIGENV